jgi:hypothetical protein
LRDQKAGGKPAFPLDEDTPATGGNDFAFVFV